MSMHEHSCFHELNSSILFLTFCTLKALEVLKEMVERGLNSSLTMFGYVDKIKRAKKVFDEMIKAGLLPSIVTYNALIQILCKKDSVENVVLVFEEMVGKGYVPNLMAYSVLVRGLCHTGEMDKALEFMGRMKDDEWELNV
ncbi:pentatricopeptide repeat-containing protein [Quercus suber]|uniref:Pentatricopeptide repeat-containing protein n=1 Tax=Quercus suber TaxID=58331 RepID=A0AAW0JU00_QUESU